MVCKIVNGMNEDDLLKQSAEERDKIFKRYEHGRKEGAQIDPWEDPKYEIYHTTDRFGFIHDQRLPSKLVPRETKNIEIEVKRQKKWLKMLKSWTSSSVKEKLHSRVYKGIPNSLRPEVWCLLLDVEKIMTENSGCYADTLKLARSYSTDARQIDCDVNRQFRDHLHYRERYSIKQQSLFNVLTAYAMYNSEVGYCQGMSTVAGMLLMYMNEEEAFWALHLLLTHKNYAMHGLYKHGFPKLQRLLAHLDKILSKFLPKVKRHLARHGVDTVLYSLKWFFVCFIERIPFKLCLRIWDIYLLDGEQVITAMAFTILKLHERQILKLKDMDSIVHYIQISLYENFGFNDDDVIHSLEKCMTDLKRAHLYAAGVPDKDELPSQPFGVFKVPPAYEPVTENKEGFKRQSLEKKHVEALLNNETNGILDEIRNSNLTVTNAVGLTDSKLSFEDGTSSILEEHTSSRHSLADTSVTSTADLSVFSLIAPFPMSDVYSSTSDNVKEGGSDNNCSSSSSSHDDSDRVKTTHSHSSSDVLRIYVPYSPLTTPVASPQNGDAVHCLDTQQYYIPDGNRILIRVDTEEQLTPLVQHEQTTNNILTKECT